MCVVCGMFEWIFIWRCRVWERRVSVWLWWRPDDDIHQSVRRVRTKPQRRRSAPSRLHEDSGVGEPADTGRHTLPKQQL